MTTYPVTGTSEPGYGTAGGGGAAGPSGAGPNLPPGNRTVWTQDGAVMVRVAGGSFAMGSAGGDDAEHPVHTVRVGTFWIDETEVTNERYKLYLDATGRDAPYVAESWASDYNWDPKARTYPKGNGHLPVVLVSWEDAAGYARWAGKRLPTEAEWEYAARGPDGGAYPWGSSWRSTACNSADDDHLTRLGSVGAFAEGASWCGAKDMAGNVWEWVADWFSPDYYAGSPSADPEGPGAGRYKVIRGGSWGSGSFLCRSTARAFRSATARSDACGFRCVADAG
jgi:formylglycine-generating enzyme required for sulfatase activity